jgi:predicted secreted protein
VNKGKGRVFGIPYVSWNSVCYERVASGQQSRCGPGNLTQGRSELCPMSFALLTVVLAMGMVALVLLLYYLLGRWR